ncbi:hypothetical protein, partial [Nocardia sp. NRRL S-836]|uniref:hypothetical protein n=1 Tax=Nocardia sp. NRRL S-836 TaxID=1519492 RepID=UPI0006BF3BBD
VTKELVINVVSLLNRSRYSMTHHTVIGYNTLSELLSHPDPGTRAEQAEAMLLHLVDEHGNPTFDRPGAPPYNDLHLACLRLAAATQADPHAITDDQVRDTHRVLSRPRPRRHHRPRPRPVPRHRHPRLPQRLRHRHA